MRFAFALTILSTLLASASTSSLLKRQSLPTCAETCITSADYGSCSQTDAQCLCTSSTFLSSVESCISSSCSESDINAALLAADALCAQAGVSLSLTGLPTASASGSASASQASSTTPASSSSASSSTAQASTTSSTSGALSHRVDVLAGLAAIAAVAFAL